VEKNHIHMKKAIPYQLTSYSSSSTDFGRQQFIDPILTTRLLTSQFNVDSTHHFSSKRKPGMVGSLSTRNVKFVNSTPSFTTNIYR